MSLSQSRKRRERRKKLKYYNKQRQKIKEYQSCIKNTFDKKNVSEHESKLRDEWKQILSDILPTELHIDLIIHDIADYAYPIHYGLYAGYWCKLLYLNRNGQCKYQWLDDYWGSPLNKHLPTIKCCYDFGIEMTENKLKYHEFEKWDYDFNTNTLSLRAYESYLGSINIFICKLKYGNKTDFFKKESLNIAQSEYEWRWEYECKTNFDTNLNNADIDQLFGKLTKKEDVEAGNFFFM